MKRYLKLFAILGLPVTLSACSESDTRAWNYALNDFNAQYSQPAPVYYPTYTSSSTRQVVDCNGNPYTPSASGNARPLC